MPLAVWSPQMASEIAGSRAGGDNYGPSANGAPRRDALSLAGLRDAPRHLAPPGGARWPGRQAPALGVLTARVDEPNDRSVLVPADPARRDASCSRCRQSVPVLGALVARTQLVSAGDSRRRMLRYELPALPSHPALMCFVSDGTSRSTVEGQTFGSYSATRSRLSTSKI